MNDKEVAFELVRLYREVQNLHRRVSNQAARNVIENVEVTIDRAVRSLDNRSI